MTLRFVHLSEIPTILEWLDSVRSPAFNWTERKLRAARLSYFALLDENGDPLTFVGFRELSHGWEIDILATRPGMEGRGLMTQTLEALLSQWAEAAREKNWPNPEIWLEVHVNNEKALKLYLKLGFVRKGERPRYYSDGGTAIVMTKALPRHGKVG